MLSSILRFLNFLERTKYLKVGSLQSRVKLNKQLNEILQSFIRFSLLVGHVNEYPTMHYFGNPRHTQSMIAYKILTEYFGKSSEKLHCGNVVNMPYR